MEKEKELDNKKRKGMSMKDGMKRSELKMRSSSRTVGKDSILDSSLRNSLSHKVSMKLKHSNSLILMLKGNKLNKGLRQNINMVLMIKGSSLSNMMLRNIGSIKKTNNTFIMMHSLLKFHSSFKKRGNFKKVINKMTKAKPLCLPLLKRLSPRHQEGKCPRWSL